MEIMSNELNSLLADLAVFYRKLQNFHWNVEGKDFFIVHAKLEEYYDEVNRQIDEIGEYILTIGGEPLGTMKDYLSISKIQEAKNEKVECSYVFTEIIKDITYLLEKVKELKKGADSMSEYGTSAMMDPFIASYSKKLWMLKQTMAK